MVCAALQCHVASRHQKADATVPLARVASAPDAVAGDIRLTHDGRPNRPHSTAEANRMLNIPTELLRALVTVTELRSFTRAAVALGVTQPAVSAQIKRLQYLLGYEVLDKSAPGVSLTPRGEIVVNNARRLLAVNDEIVEMAIGHAAGPSIRVGIPRDYAGSRIPLALAKFRERWPGVSYNVSSEPVDDMLRDLRQGELDLVLAVFAEEPKIAARHVWSEEAVWVRSSTTTLDPDGPVPLVSYGGESACQRIAVAALHGAGLDCNFVFTAHSLVSQTAAVEAGFGVMVMPRGRAIRNRLSIWEDGPLPKLPQLYGAICIRDGGDGSAIAELADYLSEQVRDYSG
jgi:DNA-binding transcriptional LysR family regulator